MHSAYANIAPQAANAPKSLHGKSQTRAMANAMPHARSKPSSFGSRRPSGYAVLLTLNQLSVMTQNGVEIAEAIESVAENCAQPRLAQALRDIHGAVSAGSTLSAAIQMHRDFFPASLPAILAAAEATGDIPSAISRVADQMRAQLQMRGTLIGAMIYPAILITASMSVFSALVLGVLPQFQKVFDTLGKPIPDSTALLLGIGDFCRAHVVWIVISVLVAAALFWRYRAHRIIVEPFFHALMHFPILRSAYRPLTTGRTFRTLASMILGGVPLLDSVRLTRRATKDPNWNALLDEVEQNLIEGKNPSDVLRRTKWLPPEAAQMMATGQKTGRVGEVLEDMGKYYEEESSRLLKRIIIAVEPVIILVMGAMVAGIVLSVLLPMLDVTSVR